MKRNSISLCLFVSFVVLAICTAFFDIPKKVFISISLSSLLYAISQTVKYHIDFMNEDTKAQIDAFNVVQGINMDSLSLFLMKRYSEWIIPTEDTIKVQEEFFMKKFKELVNCLNTRFVFSHFLLTTESYKQTS